jgi:UDP-4-amino-4-deoxy-L-arabinose-oxoglutarate aminotransferase
MNISFSAIEDNFHISHSKPCLTAADQSALMKMLRSGMIAEGTMVEKFEQAISQYLGLLGGVAASSGTDALFLAMKALEIRSGDEVIIPTYVCRSVWDAVKLTGAEPILCDIGEDWCINHDTVKPHITRRTKAIIVVHTFGIMADVEPIGKIGIPVIEDCCQSLGVKADGIMAGTFGLLCVLSFHATKLLTTGEGGMVLTEDGDLLEKLIGLKYGGKRPYAIRYRKPLSDLQAALGMSQLAQYDDFLHRRKLIADYYFRELKNLVVGLPHHIRDRSVFFRYPLRVDRDFKQLRTSFDAEGIQVRRGVDTLLHRLFKAETGTFPTAENYFKETLSIPLYPALTRKESKRIVNSCYGNLPN